MATLPAWVSQAPANLDMVAPLKARACDALYAVLEASGVRRLPARASCPGASNAAEPRSGRLTHGA